MTEYDYSPAAYERFIATQNRIAKWVDNTQAHAHEFRDVAPPIEPSHRHHRSLSRRRSFVAGQTLAAHQSHSKTPASAKLHRSRKSSASFEYEDTLGPQHSASQVAAAVMQKEQQQAMQKIQMQQMQMSMHQPMPMHMPQPMAMAPPMGPMWNMYQSPPPSPLHTPPPPAPMGHVVMLPGPMPYPRHQQTQMVYQPQPYITTPPPVSPMAPQPVQYIVMGKSGKKSKVYYM